MKSGVTIIIDKRDFKIFYLKRKKSKNGVKFTHTCIYIYRVPKKCTTFATTSM